MSEPHTSELNHDFFIIYCCLSYVILYVFNAVNVIAMGCVRTASKNFIQLGSQLAPRLKVTLKDGAYERQPGKAAGVCALIEQWIVQGWLLNSCIERLKAESSIDPPSIYG